uniref:Uncharacterized protein n=1 Tax=Brassica oleracea TaxID=3712 RepID=A0A3P6D597_BRAOL|nr:unnamed protein product [Brassica oleracea]
MSSEVYYRSWMDKPHLDPNTNLLTEEYVQGIGEFMRLVQQQPDAKSDRGVKIDAFGVTSVHSRRKLQYYDPFILGSQADQNQTGLKIFANRHLVYFNYTDEYRANPCPSESSDIITLLLPSSLSPWPLSQNANSLPVPVHRNRLMTRFPHIFPLQLPLPLTLPLTLLLNRIRGSCRFIYWFNNQVESISRFSNPTHDEAIALG